jgi:hypothetical protein
VAHACNPSYSGARDQEDCSSKPAQADSSQYPISKYPSQKIGLVEWLKVKALSSCPSIVKEKKKKSDTVGQPAVVSYTSEALHGAGKEFLRQEVLLFLNA